MTTYAGLAPNLPGVYQVNVVMPSGIESGNVFADISGTDGDTHKPTFPSLPGWARPVRTAICNQIRGRRGIIRTGPRLQNRASPPASAGDIGRSRNRKLGLDWIGQHRMK